MVPILLIRASFGSVQTGSSPLKPGRLRRLREPYLKILFPVTVKFCDHSKSLGLESANTHFKNKIDENGVDI